jgi:hypothetical protein
VLFGSDVARAVAGPFLAACALLAVAGVGKVAHPAPARVAARAAGVRVPSAGVVAFGLFEAGAAVSGAIAGGRVALAVAAAYLLLTVFAIRLLVHAPTTPCACLGAAGAPVTRVHVGVDVVAMGAALAAASGGSPLAVLSRRWVAAGVFVVLVVCCVKLAALALEELGPLAAATREGRA